MQRTVRSFIAVEISSEIRAKTQRLIAALAATSAKVKWVEPHNLHLTLKFLGDVAMLEVPELCEAVGEAVADLPPFGLEVCGAGAFPSPDRPRTIWVGVAGGTEEMVALHATLEERLATLGFRREGRRFRPHLTIGRVRTSEAESIRDLADLLAQHRDFVGGSTDVTEVIVLSSEPGREGPTYDPLSHAELGGL